MWARHGERRRPKRPVDEPVAPVTAQPPVEAAPEPVVDSRIDMLIHDVRDLRNILALDLSAAAGAAEDGAEDVVADIVEADRAAVADLVARAARLAELTPALRDDDPYDDAPVLADIGAIPSPRRRRLTRLLPAAPLAAAAAVIAAIATGTIPVPSNGPSTVRSQPVASSWHRFTQAANSDNEEQLMLAAEQLHRSLAAYINGAADDPAKAREAMKLLQLEQMLLLRERPPGMDLILAQSQQLIAALQSTLGDAGVTGATGISATSPTTSRPTSRLTVPIVKAPKPRPTSTTAPKPATTASPKASAPASPSASPSATPSPTPTDTWPLPSPPSKFGL